MILILQTADGITPENNDVMQEINKEYRLQPLPADSKYKGRLFLLLHT